MDKVRVTLSTHSHIKIESDNGIAWGLRENFSFFVPGYKFMPKYRSGIWDGKIKLFDYKKRLLPAGLYHEFLKYAKEFNYQIEYDDIGYGLPGTKNKIDPNEVMDFIKSLNLHSKGKPIQVRDYQFNAICKALQDKRLLLLSPTGSGKSLIIYVLLRYLETQFDDKMLVIVPTTSLVEQMYSDFEDYSSHDSTWNAKEELHKIYSGKEKTNVHERIFISTWQSIYKLPRTWFEHFRAIFGDEAHLFTANSLTKSMDKSSNADYRIGTTGTLNGAKANELQLIGVFGPVVKVTTTKQLQDNDTLAQLNINIMNLHYSDDIKKNFGKVSYQAEIDWIVRHEKRNKFIRNLALNLEGNTLVLFQFVNKHGKVLYDMIKDQAKHRVFYVSGEVEKDDREAIRHIVETQKNSTIVASLGTFSTGINIRNLHNLVFTSPSKSQIKVLQSIGRGLRKSDNNMTTQMYDFVDHLYYGRRRKNYSFLHGEERQKIYQEQQFNVKHYKVNL
jgi:superfamily II DNA or RNA helicase